MSSTLPSIIMFTFPLVFNFIMSSFVVVSTWFFTNSSSQTKTRQYGAPLQVRKLFPLDLSFLLVKIFILLLDPLMHRKSSHGQVFLKAQVPHTQRNGIKSYVRGNMEINHTTFLYYKPPYFEFIRKAPFFHTMNTMLEFFFV